MKKVLLVIGLVLLLAIVGVAAAQPDKGANAYIIANVTCDDGFEGDVLVPSLRARPGFFNGGIEGLGIPRDIKVTLDGTVIFEASHPGEGYETVACSYYDGPALVEMQVQRIYTGKNG